MPSTLQRGDIVLTRFPYTDLSGASVRPALVVSQGCFASDVVLAGISSVIRTPLPASDLLVETSHPEYSQTGLHKESVIRLHKLVAVEESVVVRRLGRIGSVLQAAVDLRLRLVLGL